MQKVYVGLSGGVDSATSAALLQAQGYDVTGVFIKIWRPEFIECTWREDRLDAMRVCAALSIPFREIDLSHEYKEQVIDTMIADYQRGITPNPDVLCNEKIKFGSFMQWALAAGADMIATGHYAQIKIQDGIPRLVRGVDTSKDQSYFLYRLSKDELAKAMFPIGSMKKADVREKARRFGLPVSEKPDSQGLCFVGDVSMRDFLKRFITVEAGSVIDTTGKVIGTHEGAALYTMGQRHGFTVTHDESPLPYFITMIDTNANILTVSTDRHDAARKKVQIGNVHWIDKSPNLPLRLQVQTRYHEPPIVAEITEERGRIICTFNEPHIASPGQSLVIYDDDTCLGGGIIQK